LAMRKIIGYGLLIVSCLALLFIPFFPAETTVKAAWAGGIFIFAEVTWWVAMPLLGKEIIEYFRRLWRGIKTKCQWKE
ncbi:MAG: hypothetical protein Q9M44_06380, partial [Ghiorsea sp.]|nr:hypothetical protein [Ghiorsea sp.]